MGGVYGSVHVHGADLKQVIEAALAIAEKTETKFLIGPPLNGWIGVYPSDSGVDPSVSAWMASLISADILHLVSYKEDVFTYFYYRHNKLADEYCSAPDYFGQVSASEHAQFRGCPEAFAGLLREPAKIAELRDILSYRGGPAAAEDAEELGKFSKQMMQLARTDPERLMKLAQDPRKLAAQLKVPFPRQIEMPINAADESAQLVGDASAGSDVPVEIRLFPVLAQMYRIAGVFGIKNAISSYEYLRGGEIDRIEGWSDFVSIPDRSLERALEDIAAATLSSRTETLKTAGLLLNVVSRSSKQNPCTLAWTPDLGDGYLAYWVSTRAPGAADALVYSASGEVIHSKTLLPLKPSPHAIRLSKSGRFLAVGHAGHSIAHLYNWQEQRLLRAITQKGVAQHVAFSDDETVVVTTSEGELTITPTNDSQPDVRITIGPDFYINAIAVHPHYPFIVAASNMGAVALVGIADIARLTTIRRLATSQTEPFEAWLWQAQTGVGPTGYRPNEIIRAFRFSPDGRLLFSAVQEGIRVYNWDDVLSAKTDMPGPIASAENDLVTTAHGSRTRSTNCLAFDADKRLVLFAGLEGKIRYLDLNDSRSGVLVTLPDEPSIYAMALSSNKTSLCTASVRNLFDRERANPELHFWDYWRLLDKSFSKVVSLF